MAVNRKKFNCVYVCKIERAYIINYTGTILKHNTQSILIPYEDLIYECFKKEQNILKSFDNNRINIIRNNRLFTTEAFDTDVLKGDKIENY